MLRTNGIQTSQISLWAGGEGGGCYTQLVPLPRTNGIPTSQISLQAGGRGAGAGYTQLVPLPRAPPTPAPTSGAGLRTPNSRALPSGNHRPAHSSRGSHSASGRFLGVPASLAGQLRAHKPPRGRALPHLGLYCRADPSLGSGLQHHPPETCTSTCRADPSLGSGLQHHPPETCTSTCRADPSLGSGLQHHPPETCTSTRTHTCAHRWCPCHPQPGCICPLPVTTHLVPSWRLALPHSRASPARTGRSSAHTRGGRVGGRI